jgi:capsid protein
MVEWTAPAAPMIDPEKEGLAYQRNVRIGAITWPEMVRERGYNPTRQLREIADWNKKFDAARVTLDSDPRKTSQQGQASQPTTPAPDDESEPVASNGNGSRGHG